MGFACWISTVDGCSGLVSFGKMSSASFGNTSLESDVAKPKSVPLILDGRLGGGPGGGGGGGGTDDCRR